MTGQEIIWHFVIIVAAIVTADYVLRVTGRKGVRG